MVISIIVPFYNTEKYIAQCIESILNQTFKDYEIILINDGSTDKSVEIAASYCNQHSNIKLISQKNSGQSVARNRGLKEAKGELIYFMDADDLIDENLLLCCYEKLQEENLDMVMFGYEYMCEEGVDEHLHKKQIVNECISNKKIVSGKEIFIKDIYINNTLASACTQIYRKDFLINNNLYFEENIFYEDVEFIPKILILCKKIRYINKPLYIYRRRKGSTTTELQFSEKYIYSINHVLDKLMELMYSLNSNEKELISSFRKYLNHVFKILINYLNRLDYEKNDLIQDKIKLAIGSYFNRYLEVCKDELISDDYIFFGEQITRFGSIDKEICDYIENAYCRISKRRSVINKIKELVYDADYIKNRVLSQLKLSDKNRCIGIYGISFHTESMLKYYKKKFGKINAIIYYIDSFKGRNNENINGIKIINVEDIKKYKLDCILISSYNSEKQLVENVKLHAYDNTPILRFYKDNNLLLF